MIAERKPLRQMMFADDVVLCAREKQELEEALEQWKDAMERRGTISRSKTECMCLNGTNWESGDVAETVTTSNKAI